MTNRTMVSREAAAHPETAPAPNRGTLPPMPAEEGSPHPTTTEEPGDSPQPNRQFGGEPKGGLTTRKEYTRQEEAGSRPRGL
ncbi:hypothetical protein [Methylobacterium nonmethylotrophicum]|uniref:Uncharacterized protein n=1 Tax=Methylobacterium nonmethylotrophicum TaxID=1141884 RepID=A0A4Z0NGC5_9HYPH|nr:hypothetical protein [Methylobacterium nonmethylotrophicum]TGD94671.1 hypothetical protein EU555_31605 [Methylobacterium nonmethylotrophicum]